MKVSIISDYILIHHQSNEEQDWNSVIPTWFFDNLTITTSYKQVDGTGKYTLHIDGQDYTLKSSTYLEGDALLDYINNHLSWRVETSGTIIGYQACIYIDARTYYVCTDGTLVPRDKTHLLPKALQRKLLRGKTADELMSRCKLLQDSMCIPKDVFTLTVYKDEF